MNSSELTCKVARIWADLDGCEGGDLLRALADTLEMAHYSYASEEQLKALLIRAIGYEVNEMRTMATSEDPDEYGYDPEQVEQALSEIATLEHEYRGGST